MQMCRRGISTFFFFGLVLIQIKAQDTIKSFDDLINQVNQISLTLKNGYFGDADPHFGDIDPLRF